MAVATQFDWAGFSAPLRWDKVACRQVLARGHFRTQIPSLCHPAPGGLAIRVACEFGHKLAFGGVSQKLLRRMHRVITLPGAPTPLYHSPYKGVTEKGKAYLAFRIRFSVAEKVVAG